MSEMSKARLRWEIVIVLALSYGASAVYALIAIIERVTRETVLSEQTATLNRSLAARPTFDLIYQLLAFAFGLAPVVLVAFLLWSCRPPHLAGLGLGRRSDMRSGWWIKEAGWGFTLAASIGIPGLGLYLVSRELGFNVTVIPAALDDYWWTVPVLILSALRAALGEELIVVAYLFNRFKKLGIGATATILSSALLRGTYHLYQGFGGFVGNVVMGLVFGWAYHRWGRSTPLIVAHWLLDIVSFVGYAFAVAWWPELFGLRQT